MCVSISRAGHPEGHRFNTPLLPRMLPCQDGFITALYYRTGLIYHEYSSLSKMKTKEHRPSLSSSHMPYITPTHAHTNTHTHTHTYSLTYTRIWGWKKNRKKRLFAYTTWSQHNGLLWRAGRDLSFPISPCICCNLCPRSRLFYSLAVEFTLQPYAGFSHKELTCRGCFPRGWGRPISCDDFRW